MEDDPCNHINFLQEEEEKYFGGTHSSDAGGGGGYDDGGGGGSNESSSSSSSYSSSSSHSNTGSSGNFESASFREIFNTVKDNITEAVEREYTSIVQHSHNSNSGGGGGSSSYSSSSQSSSDYTITDYHTGTYNTSSSSSSSSSSASSSSKTSNQTSSNSSSSSTHSNTGNSGNFESASFREIFNTVKDNITEAVEREYTSIVQHSHNSNSGGGSYSASSSNQTSSSTVSSDSGGISDSKIYDKVMDKAWSDVSEKSNVVIRKKCDDYTFGHDDDTYHEHDGNQPSARVSEKEVRDTIIPDDKQKKFERFRQAYCKATNQTEGCVDVHHVQTIDMPNVSISESGFNVSTTVESGIFHLGDNFYVKLPHISSSANVKKEIKQDFVVLEVGYKGALSFSLQENIKLYGELCFSGKIVPREDAQIKLPYFGAGIGGGVTINNLHIEYRERTPEEMQSRMIENTEKGKRHIDELSREVSKDDSKLSQNSQKLLDYLGKKVSLGSDMMLLTHYRKYHHFDTSGNDGGTMLLCNGYSISIEGDIMYFSAPNDNTRVMYGSKEYIDLIDELGIAISEQFRTSSIKGMAK